MDITPTTTNSADTDTTTSQTTPLPLQTHLKNALSLVTPANHLPPPQLGGGGGGGDEEEEFFTNNSYRECLKNHAASIGGLALDGCGEFMPTPNASPSDPTSLKCAACGCHRNFHRRHRSLTTPHLPPPLHYTSSSPSSSPTPHQSIFPSAPPPHLLLPLSTALSGPFDLEENHPHRNHQHRGIFNFNPTVMNPLGKKRARTKFTEQQKLKMCAFAEKLGWKMPRGNDETMVEDFCHDVGVERNVFKVWMHNNKSRREKSLNFASNINGGNNNGDDDDDVKEGILSNYGNVVNASNFNNFHRFRIESKVRVPISADGSSPSSS